MTGRGTQGRPVGCTCMSKRIGNGFMCDWGKSDWQELTVSFCGV